MNLPGSQDMRPTCKNQSHFYIIAVTVNWKRFKVASTKAPTKRSDASIFFFFFSLFIYFERERTCGGEDQREGERESQAGCTLSAQSPMQGLNPHSHEIMTWAEIESQTNWAIQAPPEIAFKLPWFLWFIPFVFAKSHILQVSTLKMWEYSFLPF